MHDPQPKLDKSIATILRTYWATSPFRLLISSFTFGLAVLDATPFRLLICGFAVELTWHFTSSATALPFRQRLLIYKSIYTDVLTNPNLQPART
jgi:hypothetical protein